MREFEIGANEAGQRFDKYLKKLLSNAPGSFVYKMLRKKNIVLNGKKADGTEKLVVGDAVKLFLADETFEKFSGGNRTLSEYESLKQLFYALQKKGEILQVVYEDANVILINKPVGLLSQKSTPQDISANEQILAYLIGKGELTEEMLRTFKPSVCNRLDRNTSGLLAAGKTLKGLQDLSKAFKERTVRKYYRCIVKGQIHENAYIKGWLVKDEKKNKVSVTSAEPMATAEVSPQQIETEYRPIEIADGFTLLEVHLITGRSHQIRAHLASIGHPILGDYKYGDLRLNEVLNQRLHVKSQLLHAYRMEFPDGQTVIAPCPSEFTHVWDVVNSSRNWH